MKETCKYWLDSHRVRYQKLFGGLLTGLTLILAFVGSWQYYVGYVDEVIENRLWSSIAYSTLQLYIFSPTVDPGEATPLCYELAKWLAPLCTAYWIFKATELLLRHSLGTMRLHRTNKDICLIFGNQESSLIFAENAVSADRMVVLVSEREMKRDEKLLLERKGIIIYCMDFLDDDSKRHQLDLRKLHLEKAASVVLFYQETANNFTVLAKLIEYLNHNSNKLLNKKLICSVQCQDEVLKQVIIQYYQTHCVGRNNLDLRLFSVPELSVVQLFDDDKLYRGCLEQARAAGGQNKINSLEEVPNPHVLIVGFGRYGQSIFKNILLTGTLSHISKVQGYEKLQITVIDQNAAYFEKMMYVRYPRLDQICKVQFIQMDVQTSKLEQELDRISEKSPITYAAVCFSSETTSLLVMTRLVKYFQCAGYTGVPVAVRMEQDDSMVRAMQESSRNLKPPSNRKPAEYTAALYENVFAFGMEKEVLQYDYIVNPHMEQRAAEFNREYEKAARRLWDTSGEEIQENESDLWKRLSVLERDSNRAQVMIRPYMRAVAQELLSAEACRALEQFEQLDIKTLKTAWPVLCELAGLEHKRWCNFMYVNGYIGTCRNARKGEYRKIVERGVTYYGPVHRCLIDDWERFLEVEELNDTVRYDLCSLVQYGKGE